MGEINRLSEAQGVTQHHKIKSNEHTASRKPKVSHRTRKNWVAHPPELTAKRHANRVAIEKRIAKLWDQDKVLRTKVRELQKRRKKLHRQICGKRRVKVSYVVVMDGVNPPTINGVPADMTKGSQVRIVEEALKQIDPLKS